MILACDPGAKPGFCLLATNLAPMRELVSYRPEEVAEWCLVSPPDEAVFEDQHLANFIYKNGKCVRVSKKSQLTLVRTAQTLFDRVQALRKYRILPDAWRRILWPGASRLTKTVVLARLRAEYNTLVEHLPKGHQPDCLEAIGIAVAWSRLTQAQKEQYRVQ